jgi:hypothetical protein
MSSFNFDGSTNRRTINLSTAKTSSTSSIIAKARAEREERESQRLKSNAATVIQRSFRKKRASKEARKEVLKYLDGGDGGWEEKTRRLVIGLGMGGLGERGTRKLDGKEVGLLGKWCREAVERVKVQNGEQRARECIFLES